MPEGGTKAERNRPPVRKNYPAEQAGDAAFHAARKEIVKDCGHVEEVDHGAARIEQAVREAAATMPTLAWFPDVAENQAANPDQEVRVSLNGMLIHVARGRDEEGGFQSGEELYGLNWTQFDQLIGRLLTLVDATFTDPQQRKAFKDMVRQNVKEWITACTIDAAADAGMARNLTAPFVGGVFDHLNPDGTPRGS